MSSRSNDYINNLPTELLSQVFDYLDCKDQPAVTTVCTRWHGILSDDRYKVRYRLRLEPELLDEENFNNLKRYRCVAIRSDHFGETNHQQRLQQYLFNSDVVEMLEEVEIVLSVTIWNNIFGSEKELNLPNLSKLHISVPIESGVAAQMRCRIIAPKLKTFHQTSNTIFEPLELFSDQIETLVIDFPGKGHFLSATLGLSFKSLRSLTLYTSHVYFLPLVDTDFHSESSETLSRLNHLKLTDNNGAFQYLYTFILGEVKNLTSLKIYDKSTCDYAVWTPKLSRHDLSLINRLKQLNELVLMIRINGRAAPNGLSLPNLRKLTTLVKSQAPLTSLPSLRSLTIADCVSSFGVTHGLHLDYNAAQIRKIAHQLELLKIINVVLDYFSTNKICTWTDLKALKMINVLADPEGLIRIVSCLRNAKFVRFTDCDLRNRMFLSDGKNDCCVADDNLDRAWKKYAQKLPRKTSTVPS